MKYSKNLNYLKKRSFNNVLFLESNLSEPKWHGLNLNIQPLRMLISFRTA